MCLLMNFCLFVVVVVVVVFKSVSNRGRGVLKNDKFSFELTYFILRARR